MTERKIPKILEIDPYLTPFEKDIKLRMDLYRKKKKELVGRTGKLTDFANGYGYFGFHRTKDGWVYREWAPAAEKMYLTGDFNQWNPEDCPMERLENGVFEVHLKGADALRPGQKVQAIVYHGGADAAAHSPLCHPRGSGQPHLSLVR